MFKAVIGGGLFVFLFARDDVILRAREADENRVVVEMSPDAFVLPAFVLPVRGTR